MKYIKYFLITCLVLTAYSCEVSYNDDFIDPSKTYGTARDMDPKFESNNLVDVTQISIYQSYEHSVTYKRTYGISRELEMNLNVDEKVLTNYNALFESQYKLLPAEYYDIPSSVAFGEKTASTKFVVTFYSEKLVKAVGLEEASNYVLPIRGIPATDEGVVADSASNVVLLHVQMLRPVVTVQIPNAPGKLDFVMDSGFDEEVTLTTQLNFTGFDKSLLAVSGKQEDVDVYNEANGTDYKLLPVANYQFSEMTVDKQNLLTINGKINANGLDDTYHYILPCRLSSSVYTIEQTAPVYFIVNITELFVSIANGGKVVPNYSNSLKTLVSNITVNLNSIVGVDINTNFIYDPSLVAQYNSENGTSYNVLDASKVSINDAVIKAGTKSVNVPYTLNVEGLGVETHYLLPFVLQTDDIDFGSVTGLTVIYIDYTKSLLGDYKLEKLETSRQRNVLSTIWPATQSTRGADPLWATAISKAQYGLGADGDYYAILFKVTDQDVDGKPGCKQIEIFTFLEAIEAFGGANKVSDNKSYYNSLTGEIRIDFLGYESWNSLEGREVYSFTLSE